MNASHSYHKNIPAQRVVNRNGMLTGKNHFATPTTMESLLKKDGIKVLNDVVVDFEKIINEFALLRNKWLGITKALDIKQWQLSNVIKLRTAGMEDASL